MIPLSQVRRVGANLQRPECVLATSEGTFFASHKGHGVVRIDPDGTQSVLGPPVSFGDLPIVPNGIALQRDGSFLIANISDAGGILRLTPDGCHPFCTKIGTTPMPPVNYVTTDETGRVWFSVSSRLSPRHLAYRRDVRNGFIGVIEKGIARVVIDGLHYTNEFHPDLENGWLYVSETFGQVITRFQIGERLVPGKRNVFAQLPMGAFVDGIALDVDGGVWAACIVANQIIHITCDGRQNVYLEDRDSTWINKVEAALDAQQMGRVHFDTSPAKTLRNISSLAFHGEKRDRLIMGSLLGDCLLDVPAPVAGREPVHWNVDYSVWE